MENHRKLTSYCCRFVQLVRKYYPDSLLHFEDFGVGNAKRLLDKYNDKHAVFNDDVYVTLFHFCDVSELRLR